MLFDLKNIDEARAVVLFLDEKRRTKNTIGLTSGCFDLIHFQHFWYFIRCRRLCDILIVGVDSDEMVRKEKGPNRPFIFDFKRAIMVDALKPVSFTFVMNSPNDLRTAAELIRPNFLFRNDDFNGKEDEIWGKEFAEKIVIIHDVKDHTSTTEISNGVVDQLINA